MPLHVSSNMCSSSGGRNCIRRSVKHIKKKTEHIVESVLDDLWLKLCNVGMCWESIHHQTCTVLLTDGTSVRNTIESL